MPDPPRFEQYPVSSDQIRRAAERIDSAIQPDSNDDPREWLTLPERHRDVLDNLNTLIEQTRTSAAAADDEVASSTAKGPAQVSTEREDR